MNAQRRYFTVGTALLLTCVMMTSSCTKTTSPTTSVVPPPSPSTTKEATTPSPAKHPAGGGSDKLQSSDAGSAKASLQASALPEPQFGLTSSDAKGLVESRQVLSRNKQTTILRDSYAGQDLNSIVTIDNDLNAMVKEVFKGKWVVNYAYDAKDAIATRNGYTDELAFDRVPSSISIFSDQPSTQGKLINKYTFHSLHLGVGADYSGTNGNTREISFDYFEKTPDNH